MVILITPSNKTRLPWLGLMGLERTVCAPLARRYCPGTFAKKHSLIKTPPARAMSFPESGSLADFTFSRLKLGFKIFLYPDQLLSVFCRKYVSPLRDISLPSMSQNLQGRALL